MAKAQTIEQMAENIRKCKGFDTEVLQYNEEGLDNLSVRIYFTEGNDAEAENMARVLKCEFIKRGYLDAEVVKLLDDDDFLTVTGTKRVISSAEGGK